MVYLSENLKLVNRFINQETVDARIKNFIVKYLGKYYENFLIETVEKQKTVEIQQEDAMKKNSASKVPVTTEPPTSFLWKAGVIYVL